MEAKTKTIVLELTEAEARVLEGAAIAAYHEWSYSGTDGLHLWSGITKLDEALQSNHQRVVVDIIPIEEMPEEWKDGPKVLIWEGTYWVRDFACFLDEYPEATHVAEMLPDVEVKS